MLVNELDYLRLALRRWQQLLDLAAQNRAGIGFNLVLTTAAAVTTLLLVVGAVALVSPTARLAVDNWLHKDIGAPEGGRAFTAPDPADPPLEHTEYRGAL